MKTQQAASNAKRLLTCRSLQALLFQCDVLQVDVQSVVHCFENVFISMNAFDKLEASNIEASKFGFALLMLYT